VLIVGGVAAADLLVVGLDLVTEREVHAGDRRTEEWLKRGHNGDGILVCLMCYEGADLPGGPRTVALVPKGRGVARYRWPGRTWTHALDQLGPGSVQVQLSPA